MEPDRTYLRPSATDVFNTENNGLTTLAIQFTTFGALVRCIGVPPTLALHAMFRQSVTKPKNKRKVLQVLGILKEGLTNRNRHTTRAILVGHPSPALDQCASAVVLFQPPAFWDGVNWSQTFESRVIPKSHHDLEAIRAMNFVPPNDRAIDVGFEVNWKPRSYSK